MSLIVKDLSTLDSAVTTCVALSPDDRLVAALFVNGCIKVWGLGSQGCPLLFDFRIEETSYLDGSLAWSKDSTTLLSGCRTSGYLWDLSDRSGTIPCTTPRLSKELEPHKEYIKAVAISPDGTEAVTGDNKFLKFFHLQSGEKYRSEEFGETCESSLERIEYSLNGDVLAAVVGPTIFVWALETGSSRRLDGPTNVWSFVFSVDGMNILAGYDDKEFRVWSIRSDNVTSTRFGPPQHDEQSKLLWPLWIVATSPTGKEVVCGYDNVLSMYQDYDFVDTGGYSLGGDVSIKANTAVYSPNGQLLAVGCHDGCVCLWRRAPNSLDCPWQLVSKHPGDDVKEIFFSQDSARLVVSSRDGGKLRVLDIVSTDY